MQLQFQEKPWDLYSALGYVVVIGVALVLLGAGSIFAIALVLFIPGYVLAAALFPGDPTSSAAQIDWIDRIALSFGLSIAVVPLLGLVLNFSMFGFGFVQVIATIVTFSLCIGYVAYWRRMHLPPEARLSFRFEISIAEWRGYALSEKVVTLLLAVSIIIAGSVLANIIMTPRSTAPFTEFYLLGPAGNATGYPTALSPDEQGAVMVGLANREGITIAYTIRVDLVGVEVLSNTSIERNRTTWSWINVTLGDQQNWTQSYTFSIAFTGIWKLQFLLYKRGVLANQELHLFIRVG